MVLNIKNLFKPKSIPISKEYQPGDIIAYSGDPHSEYEPHAYARVISPEEYTKLTGKPLPNAKTFLNGWGSKAVNNGFVYVKALDSGNEPFYNLMPALWIRRKVNPEHEIRWIQQETEYNIGEISSLGEYAVASIKKLANIPD